MIKSSRISNHLFYKFQKWIANLAGTFTDGSSNDADSGSSGADLEVGSDGHSDDQASGQSNGQSNGHSDDQSNAQLGIEYDGQSDSQSHGHSHGQSGDGEHIQSSISYKSK